MHRRERCARTILDGFESYFLAFQDITLSARERFERDERSALKAPASSPYRRLSLNAARPPSTRVPPAVEVQRRPLSVYAEAVR